VADADGDASDGDDGEVEDNAAAAAADSDTEAEPAAKAAAETSTAATSARSSLADVSRRDSPQLTASMLLLKEAQAALEAARQADAATRAKADAEASVLREQEEEVGDGETGKTALVALETSQPSHFLSTVRPCDREGEWTLRQRADQLGL
jgi:hypothetical protein